MDSPLPVQVHQDEVIGVLDLLLDRGNIAFQVSEIGIIGLQKELDLLDGGITETGRDGYV